MKKKLTILIGSLFMITIGYGQLNDSVRTRNDKPATPQSLRTPNTAPRNHEHTINRTVPQQQAINHNGTESTDRNVNQENNNNIVAPVTAPAKEVPVTPVTIKQGLTPKDTSVNNRGVMQNGQSNTTNPIRK